MGIKAQSSAHTKWLCKYHVVFSPKYRRKVIFNKIRSSIGKILRDLCKYRNNRRASNARSCSYVSEYFTEDMRIKFYGIFER